MEPNTISAEESNAIVIIRATAMFSIILCHLFQAYDNYLASVFNIGVQVFLVMSGYLYGKKAITDWGKWAEKRFIKLYIPYFIVAATVTLLLLFFKAESIKWYKILALIINVQGFKLVFHDYIPSLSFSGLSHLWFMTAIMFAYFTTPLLQRLKKYSELCMVILLASVLFIYTFIACPERFLFGFEWLWLYAFGYFFSNISSKTKKLYIVLFSICYLYLFMQIHQLQDIGLWRRLGRHHHCTLGILLFTLGVTLLRRIPITSRIMAIFKWFDKYSFFIFLTHFVVMIGDFSLAHITESIVVNILLMLTATAILTYLLVMVNNQITTRIKSLRTIK
jgi:peptidoglycan/LPS O-acetylase OafA/YrhL